ncbi:EF-hand [Coccomyxa subellipsoidea C-169]|uniref:EF-hand n=1 Tax=Coccomyxa subellipsoidea (strain C-169) TaxID=574566 RepID=I0Z3I4_COCSC|nr:EF-hand [Coccomyxa subellipsoidea C-169]EIE25203.1 EF-hand [Coccomyxa subellipsoidea C-169]|eukprot:XP_005649747.1 EF-hand [Coccomyxa subellipsoidea C-169]
MGNSSSSGFQDGVMSKKDLERMQRRFSRLANGSGKVSIADLEQNADLSGNVFIPCIFGMYADSKGFLSQKDFTSAIERLGQLYTGQDRAEFAFQLYDKDGDGFVSPEELLAVLRMIMGRGLSEKALEQIVAATVAEHDKDGDGLLSQSEFKSLLAASSEAQASISIG